MKRILYSALIIPNDTRDSYLRTTKVSPIITNIKAPLYYVVRLVPLPIAKKWGNQHYNDITVVLSPKFKPYELCVFDRQMPLFFDLINKEVNKWLQRTDITDEEKFPLQLDLNIAVQGAIVEFDLGQDVFATRPDSSGIYKPIKITTHDDDGSLIQRNLIIRTSRTFLYGYETDTPEIYIERARQQILAHSIPVTSSIIKKD
jgi:hypothetical protein